MGWGHHHNDSLDLQLYAHGLPVTVDGGQRPGYCRPNDKETRVHNLVEVNGLSPRLDLSGEHVREALAAGVRIVCSTDAHSTGGLGNMALAVHTARRGGATRADVLNASATIGA